MATTRLSGSTQGPYGILSRGQARWQLNEDANALADFDGAIRLAPQDSLALVNRGRLWYATKAYNRLSQTTMRPFG